MANPLQTLPRAPLAGFEALLADCPFLEDGYLTGTLAPAELTALKLDAQAAAKRLEAAGPGTEPVRATLRSFRSVRTKHGLAQIFAVFQHRLSTYQTQEGGSLDVLLDPMAVFAYEDALARQRIAQNPSE